MSDFNHLTKKDGPKLRRPIWIPEIRVRATRRIGELSKGLDEPINTIRWLNFGNEFRHN